MKVIYHEPKDPELFEAAKSLHEQHQDFEQLRSDDNGCSFYNKKVDVCIVISHPYSIGPCNPTPP
jgi:hypothetical protein